MPRGGRLSVRIAIVEVNEEHVQRHPEARTGGSYASANRHRHRHFAGKSLAHLRAVFTTKRSAKAPA